MRWRRKPGDNDFLERAESLLAIQNTFLRLQNLKSKLLEEQVTTEFTSYNFLNRVQNLLSTADYIDLSDDLVIANLDNRVAAGPKVLEITLTRLRKTISVLEPVVENLKGKTKIRSAHTIDVVEETTQPEPFIREKPSDWKYSSTTSLSRAVSGGNKTSSSPAPWTPTPMNYSSAKPSSPCPRQTDRKYAR